jgi:hypothetical protein
MSKILDCVVYFWTRYLKIKNIFPEPRLINIFCHSLENPIFLVKMKVVDPDKGDTINVMVFRCRSYFCMFWSVKL